MRWRLVVADIGFYSGSKMREYNVAQCVFLSFFFIIFVDIQLLYGHSMELSHDKNGVKCGEEERERNSAA